MPLVITFWAGCVSLEAPPGPLREIADICPSAETVALDYTLPASGDLTVPITIP